MLQFLLSVLRQSKPSTRTGAGVWPNFIRTHPRPFRAEGEGGAWDKAMRFSLPKCSSWITGFEALLGGDPQKNGGDEATWLQDFSAQFPYKKNKNFKATIKFKVDENFVIKS